MDIHNIVLLGEAGSGKTEIAANIAIRLAEKDEKPVYLIDMDQTKCLFRARDFSSFSARRIAMLAAISVFPLPASPSSTILCISIPLSPFSFLIQSRGLFG